MLATRYNRETIICTSEELASLAAQNLLDIRAEYFVDSAYYVNPLSGSTYLPSGGVTRQEARSGDYTLAAADANTILPSGGAGTTTLNADTFGDSFVGLEIPVHAAGTRTLAAGAGVTLVVVGGGAASVSTVNSALIVSRGAGEETYVVQKVVV